MKKVTQILHELADREAIRDGYMRYARAIDRADKVLHRTVYWPEGRVDYGAMYQGDVAGWLDLAESFIQSDTMQAAHFVHNMLIDIHGNLADCEAYFIAYQGMTGLSETLDAVRPDGGRRRVYDLCVGTRFVDRWEKRDDEWRVLTRKIVFEWSREFSDSTDWDKGLLADPRWTRSAHDRSDVSYKLMNLQNGGVGA